MAHVFVLVGLTRLPIMDEYNQEVGHYWFIQYTLETPKGNYVSQYYAEANQLSEDPTNEEIETLILSLYGEGYDVVAPGDQS